MGDIIVLNDLAYGEHERQRMDVYIPSKAKSKSGVILFIHGGGWSQGDKSVHAADARYRCECGYLSVSMNYRYVSETVDVFDELDDVTSALNAAADVCRQYGFCLEKLFLSGGSAGAHLSLLYALTRQATAPVKPVGVFAYCPPIDCSAPDFLLGISGEFEDWKYEVLSKCCGVTLTKQNSDTQPSKQALLKISPITYVDDLSFPVAIGHGKKDELVPFGQSISFLRELEKRGLDHDLTVYENSGHALDKDPDADLRAKEVMAQYLEKVFTD